MTTGVGGTFARASNRAAAIAASSAAHEPSASLPSRSCISACQPDAVRIAIEKAAEFGHDARGSVLASDAFFPFADGPELALDAGVTAIVQPGGSRRDDEVVAAVTAAGAAMVFTGRRHFRH